MNSNVFEVLLPGMRNLLLTLAVISTLGAAPAALAQDETGATAVSAALEEEAVSSADLGVAEPTVLPTSPFYFLKTLTRTVRTVFTFNPIKKAELEIRIADEKLAETKKLAEANPERVEAIEHAIENYQKSAERVAARIESLRETSQNPNVDRLLSTLADRTVKHEKLFDELKTKFESEGGITERLEAAAKRVEETAAAAAKKDDPEKFAEKLEQALVETKGSDFKHFRSIEIIDRIHDKADDNLKEKLTAIRRDFSERLQESIGAFAASEGGAAPQAIQDAIEQLPGDRARRLTIIEELKGEAGEARIKQALENAGDGIATVLAEREEDRAAHAAEAVRHAEDVLQKLETALERSANIPTAVASHARESREHLANAKRALEAKQYGEALGQARSAEVLARNALKMLEEERPESGELKEKITALEAELNGWEARIASLAADFQARAKEALAEARKHVRFAADALTNNAPREAKQHFEEAKSYVRLLERIFETSKRGERKEAPKPAAVRPAPIKVEPAPVLSRCEGLKRNLVELESLLTGSSISREDYNRKYETLKRELAACTEGIVPMKPTPPSTDSTPSINSPRPELGTKAGQDGSPQAGSGQVLPPPKAVEPPQRVICTQEYAPVCGTDGKTYSNACHAKAAGVGVKYRGVCGQPAEETVKPQAPSSTDAGQTLFPPPTSVEPTPPVITASEFKIEADDYGFYPSSIITVPKGAKVTIHFIVRERNVYYGGLDFRSAKFKTASVKPGGTTIVTFEADENLLITSYWPTSSARKADLKVEVY